jgi:DNA-binding beta-propeller fold protein YncE
MAIWTYIIFKCGGLRLSLAVIAAIVVALAVAQAPAGTRGESQGQSASAASAKGTPGVPRFEWDPTWPKPLPDDWVLGRIDGLTIDSRDHIWVSHDTPLPLKDAKPFPERVAAGWVTNFGNPAPQILEFDQAGKLVRSLGGPGWDFDLSLNALYVDKQGNIWFSGASRDEVLKVNGDTQQSSGRGGDQLVELGPDGKFLMQIGHMGQSKGSNDTQNLKIPGGVVVDEAANEVYVADGYGNRRIIVFDARTGAYKRHWAAYGNKPDDTIGRGVGASADAYLRKPTDPPSPQFHSPVTCVRIGNDGLVYVCDRDNGRIQVFRKDGSFVKEYVIVPRGAADMAFSHDPEQRFMYVVDFTHERVWIVRRADGAVVGSFGHAGRFGGQFSVAHNIAVDHSGNIYVAETWGGRRVQRFRYMGLGFADASEVTPPPQPPDRVDPSVTGRRQ